MADETNLEQEFPWGLNEVDESLDFHAEGGSLEDVKSNQCRKLKRDKNYHQKFIYVNDFSEKHVDDWVLGLTLQEKEEVVVLVKELAHNIVRIYIPYISKNRPAKLNGKPYIFANKRGRHVGASGSGVITGVEGPKKGPCRCKICTDSGNETDKHLLVMVSTARHVIFDDSEGEKCKCVLFDELVGDQGAVLLNEKVDVEVLIGATVELANSVIDNCTMKFYVHDEILGEKIKNMWVKSWNVKERLAEIIKPEEEVTKTSSVKQVKDTPQRCLERLQDDIGTDGVFAEMMSAFINLQSLGGASQDSVLTGEMINENNISAKGACFDQSVKVLKNLEEMKKSLEKQMEKEFSDIRGIVNMTGNAVHDTTGVSNTASSCQVSMDEKIKNQGALGGTELERSNSPISTEVTKVIVIGHAHGKAKQITLGETKGKVNVDGVRFSAHTCPGTSGGYVFPIKKHANQMGKNGFWQYSHSGAVNLRLGVSSNVPWLF